MVPSLVLVLWHNLAWESDLFLSFDNLPIYFHNFLYKVILIVMIIILIGDRLFTLSNGKSAFFYYYYYYHVCLLWLIQSSFTCHGHMNEALGKWDIVCAQAELGWVITRLVPTPLSRTFGPNTTGVSIAQHYKKAHHNSYIYLFIFFSLNYT